MAPDTATTAAPSITVAVATHKAYAMPTDAAYLPLHVGKALHPELDLGFQGDDTGDSISALNAYYSELTGLWWLWKNVDAPYKGLVHYRRHFKGHTPATGKDPEGRLAAVATGEEYLGLLDGNDIILPKRRNYYIETIRSHYAHTLPIEQLDVTRQILEETQPDYVAAFDDVMGSRGAHMFNMMVMSSERLDEYCSWLFPILAELTHRIDPAQYDAFNARYPGRVSERLMDVWLKTCGYGYAELPTLSPEPVDWLTKGKSFLAAKFLGKKYGASF